MSTTETTFKVGDYVTFNCIENFGYRAVIIAERDSTMGCHWRIRSLDGTREDWAYTGELTPDTMTRDDVIRSTAMHIRRVGQLLTDCTGDLNKRAVNHDASKWSEREWPLFEKATPQLAGLKYGSDEYRAALKAIKPAIDHHNSVNAHHPEHHARGVDGMTLLDLVEMMCDWKAATERHATGDIAKSIEINRERFKIEPQLEAILVNTVKAMGWVPKEEK